MQHKRDARRGRHAGVVVVRQIPQPPPQPLKYMYRPDFVLHFLEMRNELNRIGTLHQRRAS
jgi:hypothetical protein